MSGVHRLLVTAGSKARMRTELHTGPYANWLEGRINGHGTETWWVTVMETDGDRFLAEARETGVTVEEVLGTGDGESYNLVVGKPGSGWVAPPAPVRSL